MLIPLGTTSLRRRFPWVTVGLITLNAVVFLLSHGWVRAQSLRLFVAEGERRRLEYQIENTHLHPDGRPPKEFVAALAGKRTPQQEDFWRRYREGQVVDVWEDEYVRWRHATEAVRSRTDEHLFWRFGFRKSNPNPLTILTSMFLHDGYLHVIFNMLYLWVVGVNMEDVWGGRLFALFYFLGGVAATGIHAVFMPGGSDVPSVGASGAVAGVMGAFLVRHFATKIRFWLLFPYFGAVSLKAGFILPIWIAFELKKALGADASNGGVAFWAHVGGFGAGAAVALLFRAGRVEEAVAPELEQQDRMRKKAALLEQASIHQQRGEGRLLLETLGAAVESDPRDAALGRQHLDLLCRLGNEPAARQAGIDLLRLLWGQGDRGTYAEVFDVVDGLPGGELPAIVVHRAAVALSPTLPQRAAELAFRVVQARPDEPLRTKALELYAGLLDRLGAPDRAAAVRRLIARD